MAELVIPYINPLRYQKESITIDYDTKFPFSDNMRLREDYQRGVYAIDRLYPDFVVGKKISVLFKEESGVGNVSARILTPSNPTYPGEKITITNITPSGFASGDTLWTGEYEITEVGVHQIITTSNTIRWSSDEFKAHNSGLDSYVQIEYYDTQNRYGGYFFESAVSQVWEPRMYYTGNLKSAQPSGDQSIYTNDSGDPLITRSEPQRNLILTLTDIHETYIDTIFQQSMCDNYFVNGVKMASIASDFTVEPTEKSDVVNITMKMIVQDNDYNFKY